MHIPRRRRYNLILPLLYPLSQATRLGRCLGLPRPCRLTAPPSITCSKTVASCCWPGVSTKVIGLPLPSHRICILVLNPPLLRPNASFSASPLLRQQHADGRVLPCRPRSGLPNLSFRQ